MDFSGGNLSPDFLCGLIEQPGEVWSRDCNPGILKSRLLISNLGILGLEKFVKIVLFLHVK